MCYLQGVLLPFLPLNKMHIPLSIPETFVDHSCIGLIQLHVDNRLPSSPVEHTVILPYLDTTSDLDIGVFLRVPA